MLLLDAEVYSHALAWRLVRFSSALTESEAFWAAADVVANDVGSDGYCFVLNSPVDYFDALGLKTACPKTPGTYLKCSPCNPGDTTGKQQDSTKKNESNGCGPFFLFWKIPGGWVFKENPSGLSGCSFTSACDFHDCCYGWCQAGKDSCDTGFYDRMKAICDSCTTKKWSKALCYFWAEQYYKGVAKLGGKAYDGAQKEVCRQCCCPSKKK